MKALQSEKESAITKNRGKKTLSETRVEWVQWKGLGKGTRHIKVLFRFKSISNFKW